MYDFIILKLLLLNFIFNLYNSIRHEDSEKIWVPPALRQTIIELYHDPPNAGHRGANATSQNFLE